MVYRDRSTPSVDAAIESDQARAWDRVVGWLALYLPTVGTSVMLHVALVLLAAVLIPFASEPPPEFDCPESGIVTPPPEYETARRPRLPSPHRRDVLDDSTVYSIKYATLEAPGFGENPLADLSSVIGIGPSRKGGAPDYMPDPGRPRLFDPIDGRPEETSVVYLVDRSGSMTDSIDYVKYELKVRIAELPESCVFHVIFFSSGPPVEMPTRRLVPATERNKRLALEFIDGVVARGETDPSGGFDRAFAAQPRTIHFLTDGEFDKAVIGQVDRLNAGREVTVHTIGFLYRPNEEAMRTIAERNGGEYTFISHADLDRLGV
ncbi:MAG: VWA domain-containing protein [Phycisphaerae bacterium]